MTPLTKEEFLNCLYLFFKNTSFKAENLVVLKEKNEYNASSFFINNQKIISRTSKITPKKIGQFVAIWKRDKNQCTTPYFKNDVLDFLVIICNTTNKKGMFLFPKEILLQKNIISNGIKEGKRGMRVYPSWDVPKNAQAIKTQKWQLQYFTTLPLKKEIHLHCQKLFF